MMKKNLRGNLTSIIAIVLLAGIMSYFYIQLNRTEKLALKVQQSAVTNSGTISEIVNLFNSNLNAQQ